MGHKLCRDREGGDWHWHPGEIHGHELYCWGKKTHVSLQQSDNSFASHGAAVKGWLLMQGPINANCMCSSGQGAGGGFPGVPGTDPQLPWGLSPSAASLLVSL